MATATATEPVAGTSLHHEDVETIQQLAKLQQMHGQIHELRSLLPNALLGPSREAIAKPDRANPTKFAIAVSKAAHKGRQDIQSFKQDWQSEKTRKLFRDANAANIPQGNDTWHTNYRLLVKSSDMKADPDSRGEDVTFDTSDEAKVAFEDFNKSEHKIKLQASDQSKLFPIDAEISRMHFRISQDDVSNIYKVEVVTLGSLPQHLVEQVSLDSSFNKLGKLLVRVFRPSAKLTF